jgi:hypothetical protein
VAGLYFTFVVNIIEAKRENSLRSFLLRMQGDQDELRRHTNAPLMEIMKDLNEDGSGLGDITPDLLRQQYFNWAPGLGATTAGANPFENTRQVQSCTA